MTVEVFVLCDAATDSGGKLNILGAFDSLWMKDFPSVHPHCAIALRLRFSAIERGNHRVMVSFVDQDGKAVIPALDGNIAITFPDEQKTGAANLILHLQGLKIEKAGEYSIDLAVDGQQKASLPLFVRPRK